MIKPLLKIFKGKSAKKAASIPDGERVYVIGDIHGRLDLFDALVRAIEEDDKDRQPDETLVILLGDLVDRGPESSGVIKLARLWEEYRPIRYLIGNHEEMFIESFDENEVMRHFLKHGGRETILSYGVSETQFNNCSTEELRALMASKVPEGDITFLKAFEDMIIIGDYLFVHAGINPKRSLDEQKPRELRWIREPFLNHKDRHSHIVVHGHTIVKEIDEKKNRIGIDTGAYKFGTLTALVLEGDTRRYIQAVETKTDVPTIVHTQASEDGQK